MRAKFVVAVAGLLSVMGCDPGPEKVEHPRGDEAWEMAWMDEVDGQQVVAQVNGSAITVEDVALMWRDEPDLEADEVVEMLVEREILAQEARRRGYHERPEVFFARKQGMVAALLAEEIEEQAEPQREGRDEKLERFWERRRVPAGLRASHLVILVPEELDGERLDDESREEEFLRARRWIEEVSERLGEDVDDDDLRRMASRLNEEVLPEGFEAVVNEHLRFPRAGQPYVPERLPDGWVSVLPEFAKGAETVVDEDVRGQLSEPVRTRLGWHLIRVLDVTEAQEPDEEALEAYVDRRLTMMARDRLLREKMVEWSDGVEVDAYSDRLGSVLDE